MARVAADELVHHVALRPIDDFLGHGASLDEILDQAEGADGVFGVDFKRGGAGRPDPGHEVEGAFLVLQAAESQAVDVVPGALGGHVLELVPGGGHLAAGGGEHVLVVVQRQAVAAEGDAVEHAVQGAAVDGALIEGGGVELAGHVREDAHGGIAGMVGAVDDDDIGAAHRRSRRWRAAF